MSSPAIRNIIFVPPILGKPDPTQDRPLNGPDTRRRVVQAAQKGNTCWCRVMDYLRERWKAPNTADLPERRFERLASARRRVITTYELDVSDDLRQAQDPKMRNYFLTLSKETVRARIEKLENSGPETRTLIRSFLRQNHSTNVYDYMIYLRDNPLTPEKRIEINLQFLRQLQIDPQDLFSSFLTRDPEIHAGLFSSHRFAELPPDVKSHVLDGFVLRVCVDRYDLTASSWKPDEPFSSLFQELETYGPLGVGGHFGAAYYGLPPEKLKVIQGREIYGWKRGVPRLEKPIGHAILIIGAEKVGNAEVVYFIDPLDESDPDHPEKQRVYAMSYQNLTLNIGNLNSVESREIISKSGYAFRRKEPRALAAVEPVRLPPGVVPGSAAAAALELAVVVPTPPRLSDTQ